MSSNAKLLLPAAAIALGAALFLALGGSPSAPPLPSDSADGPSSAAPDRDLSPSEASLAEVGASDRGARRQADTAELPRTADASEGEPLPALTIDVQVNPESGTAASVSGSVVVVERSALEAAGGESIGEAVHLAAASGRAVRTALEADGSALLEVPSGFVDPVLAIADRHWYAPRPVGLDGDTDAVILEARQGACLVLRPMVSQGTPSGTMSVSGFDMRGRRSGMASLEIELSGQDEILVRGLDSARAWTMITQADNHHCAVKSGVEMEPGSERIVELSFVPGAALAGRVVDTKGNGVEGVEVATESRNPWLRGAEAKRTTTDASGAFALAGVAPGKVQLEAKLEGWRDAEIAAFEVADMERRESIEIVMDRGASITGTVSWPGGDPAAGARVRASRMARQQWGGFGGSRMTTEGETVAAEDGSFELTGLTEGQFTIRASHRPADMEDDPSAPRWRASELAKGGASLDLILTGPEMITGKVVDDRGEPVTAFDVVADSSEPGVRDERSTFEDPDGTFRFARIGTGAWTLEARAGGLVPVGDVPVELPGAPAPITLRMARTAQVAGTVVDPFGKPLSGAEVRVEDPGQGQRGWGGGSRTTATSNKDGQFNLTDLPPETTTLVVRATGWADSEPVTFELSPAEERTGVTLRARKGGRIVGAVLESSGDPIAGQRVTYGTNSMGFGSRGETKTSSDGSFEFEAVTPGTWTVSATPSMEEMSDRMNGEGASFVSVMGELVAETVDVPDGETVEVFLGGEPRTPVNITGVVTRGGEVVADAEVFATSEGSAIFEGMKSARTNAEGAYMLTVDRPGAYLVSVQDGQTGIEVAVDVPRVDSKEVDLSIPDTMLTGRIRRPDGEPAVGIRIAVQREDGLGRLRWNGDQATSKEDGRWELPSLPPGVYTVRVNTSSWQGRSEKRWGKLVRTGITLEENATVDGLDFELEDAGTVAGLVRGVDGSPLGGATVFLRDASGAFVDRVSGDVTDAAGAFECTGIAPGAYTVSVRGEGFATNDGAACTVRSGETAEVDLRVDDGIMLEISVVNAEGEPLRGRVEVFDRDEREVGAPRTVAQVQRQFNAGVSTYVTEVGPLPPGRYEIVATTEDGRSEDKRLNVRAGSERRKVRIKIKD